MTAETQLVDLIAVVFATTVQNGRRDRRAIGEFTRLVVDLQRQLARRRQNERRGEVATTAVARVRLETGLGSSHSSTHAQQRLRTRVQNVIDDRQQEGSRLSRSRLGAGHQIAVVQQRRNRVLLHGRRHVVLRQFDVLQHPRVQLQVGELDSGDSTDRE